MEYCNSSALVTTIYFIKNLLNIVGIIVPIILCIVITIIIFKLQFDMNEIKNAWGKISKKIIAAVIIFFIPSLVNFTFNLIDYGNYGLGECWNNANSEMIKKLKIIEKNEKQAQYLAYKEEQKRIKEEVRLKREAEAAAKLAEQSKGKDAQGLSVLAEGQVENTSNALSLAKKDLETAKKSMESDKKKLEESKKDLESDQTTIDLLTETYNLSVEIYNSAIENVNTLTKKLEEDKAKAAAAAAVAAEEANKKALEEAQRQKEQGNSQLYDNQSGFDPVGGKIGYSNGTFTIPSTRTSGQAGTKGTGEYGLNKYFWEKLSGLINEAKQKGYNITVSSGWRSYEGQLSAYKRSRAGYAAKPGGSRHGWGLAADLRFNGTSCGGKWNCNAAATFAHQNASKYGLVFRLTSSPLEPWHIEPVKIVKR